MKELAYDIEQYYIEGYSPKSIAALLECPVEIVYDWIEGQSLSIEEEYNPYETINS